MHCRTHQNRRERVPIRSACGRRNFSTIGRLHRVLERGKICRVNVFPTPRRGFAVVRGMQCL